MSLMKSTAFKMILVPFFFSFLFLQIDSCFAELVRIKHVIDGDTAVLEDGTRVRLIGIDAPEIENRNYGHRGEVYGEESKEILKGMIEGKEVDLQDGPEKMDRYQRRLAYIYLPDNFFVNRNLVEVGAAEAYRRFPHPFSKEFYQLEKMAKEKKLGMWATEQNAPAWWKRLLGMKR